MKTGQSLFAKVFNLTPPQEDLNSSYQLFTDHRLITDPANSVFFALKGEKFNGIKFVEELLGKGIAYVVVNRDDDYYSKVLVQKNNQHQIIAVPCVIRAFGELAKNHSLNWQRAGGVVIGITGSNGKTTTKDMLGELLRSVCGDQIWVTQKNYNNHLGVPAQILSLGPHHQYAVIEMGTNHPGEIEYLCNIAQPSCGIITNIGDAHLEFLISRDGVLKEKGALFEAVLNSKHPVSFFVLNLNDLHLRKLPQGDKTITVSKDISDNPHFFMTSSSGQNGFELKESDTVFNFFPLKIGGEHNFENMALAHIAAKKLLEEKLKKTPNDMFRILNAAKNFIPRDMRSEWVSFHRKNIFLDAYNANPSSFRASLHSFFVHIKNLSLDTNYPIVLILGSMHELGDFAPKHHREIGLYLRGLIAQQSHLKYQVYFVGKSASDYQHGFGGGEVFESSLQLRETIFPYLADDRRDAVVFIKGSRSLQLESILDKGK